VNIGQLIASYGYWALFGLVAAESLGVPLPGETALIIAGTYAGTTHHLNPWLIFAVASAAAIIGDNIGFWIGDKGGYRLARRYGSKVRLDERKLKTARYLFDRHGTKVVFFGRFVSVLRTYAAFLAGTSRMRWRKFPPANAAGGIVWAGIYPGPLDGLPRRPEPPDQAGALPARNTSPFRALQLAKRRGVALLPDRRHTGPASRDPAPGSRQA
jgi:membrane protein DedA with SNARE-associated domain